MILLFKANAGVWDFLRNVWVFWLQYITLQHDINQGLNRVLLKWWYHENYIFEIMEFVGVFWKNNFWKGYLPKASILGKLSYRC